MWFTVNIFLIQIPFILLNTYTYVLHVYLLYLRVMLQHLYPCLRTHIGQHGWKRPKYLLLALNDYKVGCTATWPLPPGTIINCQDPYLRSKP